MIGSTLYLFMSISVAVSPTGSLSYYIDRLGSDSELAQIDQYGCSAVGPLADSLRLVKSGHYPPTHQPEAVKRAVFSVAALRYITGIDFYATVTQRTIRRYDSSGQQFLTEGAPKGHIKFFGIWMSRGSLYLAPEKAQEKIISSWKRYARSGACKHSTWPGRDKPNFYLSGIGRDPEAPSLIE